MRPGRLISTNDPSSRYPLEGADHAWIIAMPDSHLDLRMQDLRQRDPELSVPIALHATMTW